MRKVLLLAALPVMIMAMAGGCATHISGLQDNVGAQTLYVFNNEHTAFAAAYGAIVAVLPNAPVKAVSGPMRGYSVNDDKAVFDIRILPGAGKSIADGSRVFGYYVETSLHNDSIIDRFTIQKVYRAIVEVFAVVGDAVQVDGIRLGKYKSAAFLRDSGEDGDEEDDLALTSLIVNELNKRNRPVAAPANSLSPGNRLSSTMPPSNEPPNNMPPSEKAGQTEVEAETKAAAAERGSANASFVDALSKLNQLRRDGGLTWEEYNELKERIIRE